MPASGNTHATTAPARAETAPDARAERPRARNWLSARLLVLPWSLWLLLLYALPLGFIVLVSFWRMEGDVLTPAFTLDNYREIFSGGAGDVGLLLRTCATALVVVAIVTLLCYPLAYFLVFRMRSAGAAATTLTLVALPFLVGPLVRSIAWKGILGVQGVVNGALESLGLIGEPLEWLLFSRFAVIVALVYNTYPFMLFALVLSMQTVDRSLVAAARDLGAGAFTAFRRVVLPLSVPGFLVGFLLAFVPAVSATLEPELLGGTSGRAFANAISDRFLLAIDWPGGAAMTTVFTAAVALIAVVVAAVVLLAFRGAFGGEPRRQSRSRTEVAL